MTKIFDLEIMDLIKLRRFYKNAPKQFGYTTASLLNTFAFNTRKEALKVVHKEMNIRNQSFVISQMRYKKAKGSEHINSQESETFSIKGKRFSGWVEQETGKKTDRTRVASTLARGGSNSGQIKPAFRMKPGKNFLSPDELKGDNKAQRLAAMFHKIEYEKYKKPFIIKGSNKFKSGIYRRVRNKIKILQSFKAKNAQPKRIKWMAKARRNNFKTLNLRNEWRDAINRTLKFK